ncbi:cytochrome p450 [Rhyzopertha dominica]|nr:cytochrome p450 [Rhyzopertha dominica]
MALLTLVLLAFIFGLIFVKLILSYNKRSKIDNMLKNVPGPFSLPFVGSVSMVEYSRKSKLVQKFHEGFKKYGPHIKCWIGNTLIVQMADPTDCKMVLNATTGTEKAHYAYHDVKEYLGNGMLTADYETWKTQRHILNKSFRSNRFDNYVEYFQKYAEKLVDGLANGCTADVNLFHTFFDCFINAAYDALIGPLTDRNQAAVHQFGTSIARLGEIACMRLVNPFLQLQLFNNLAPWDKEFNKLNSQVKGFVKKVISKAKKIPTGDYDDNNCRMVELLLNASCSDQQIEDEITSMLTAASETSASAMTFAMILLGFNPQVQDNVYREVMSNIGPSGEVNGDNISKLKYTEMVLLETLRLFPSVPFISRESLVDIRLKSFTVPAGSIMMVNIFSMHRNEDHWSNPSEFVPERFSSENVNLEAFMPFSSGARKCMGYKFAIMELKTLLANLVRRYRITTNYKSLDDIKLTYGIILHPSNGSQCTLEERKVAAV